MLKGKNLEADTARAQLTELKKQKVQRTLAQMMDSGADISFAEVSRRAEVSDPFLRKYFGVDIRKAIVDSKVLPDEGRYWKNCARYLDQQLKQAKRKIQKLYHQVNMLLKQKRDGKL